MTENFKTQIAKLYDESSRQAKGIIKLTEQFGQLETTSLAEYEVFSKLSEYITSIQGEFINMTQFLVAIDQAKNDLEMRRVIKFGLAADKKETQN